MRFSNISKDNGTLITLLGVGIVGGISSIVHKKGQGLRRDLSAADLSVTTVEALEDIGAGAMNRQLSFYPSRRT
jgi:hypothetical protein